MSKKQRTREARVDEVDLAFVDDLRLVAEDLCAPRLSVSRGAGAKDGRGRCAEMPFRPESLGTVIFAQLTPLGTTMFLEKNVPSTT